MNVYITHRLLLLAQTVQNVSLKSPSAKTPAFGIPSKADPWLSGLLVGVVWGRGGVCVEGGGVVLFLARAAACLARARRGSAVIFGEEVR